MAYLFTDPLGPLDPVATRRRIRHAHAVIYGAATPSLLMAVLMDGGPVSERLAAGGAMLATGLLALLMLSWRRAPDALLLAAFPLGALVVTSVVVFDPPLALTPMFYVWPLLIGGYFLRRRELLLTYGAVCASFGAASLWSLDDGPRLIQWITVAMVSGVVTGFVAALKSGLEDTVARLEMLAREDPLTGALNRRAFMQRLDVEIARARRDGAPCAVALIDVDHFKAINDDRGHSAGDAALRRLVETITRRLRRGDALGRIGGDELAIVLAGTDLAGAEAYGEGLRALVADEMASAATPCTVSVGVAALPPAGASAEGLLDAADGALYQAKRAGRDTVRAADARLVGR